MQLTEIYQPIKNELKEVEKTLEKSLSRARNGSILKVNRFVLDTPGKRLRPALVILSAKAAVPTEGGSACGGSYQLIKIASAIELIHTASLIHDDVIDHSQRRHDNQTVNSLWGEDVSITLGDYLYSLAFELISGCANPDILGCICQAAKAMCEGELLQVLERDNLSLLREKYMLIIKQKTASLFAASCQAGAIASNSSKSVRKALADYGMNFGIAFQMIDDCLDLMGQGSSLGKAPGQDIRMGEVTLPLLNLLKSVSPSQRQRLKKLLKSKDDDCLEKIRQELNNSNALEAARKICRGYLDSARERLKVLANSPARESLLDLGDYLFKRVGQRAMVRPPIAAAMDK